MSRTITLRPPAKINLTLRVGPRNADGFHDVRTVLQSIAISDTLTFSQRPGPFAIGTRAPGIPTDRTNLIWRAAAALWRQSGREGDPRDVHVKLDKQIPAAAGLGGGSADAAATLLALNVLWEARCPHRELRRVGATLGSDVPFFLQGGTALGAGRGDELYPVDDAHRLGVVLLKPSFGVATADAYRWLDEDRAAGESSSEVPARAREVDLGWPSGALTVANDLEAPVARRHPAIREMVEACIREGAIAAAMTGSGSAVYGLFSEAVAPKAARRLHRPDWLVMVTRFLPRREAGRRVGL